MRSIYLIVILSLFVLSQSLCDDEELQAEVAHLKEENTTLRHKLSKKDAIVRHKQPYITFAEDKLTLKYCAICWDSDEKTIQMDESMASGCIRLFCRKCGNKCYVSRV